MLSKKERATLKHMLLYGNALVIWIQPTQQDAKRLIKDVANNLWALNISHKVILSKQTIVVHATQGILDIIIRTYQKERFLGFHHTVVFFDELSSIPADSSILRKHKVYRSMG